MKISYLGGDSTLQTNGKQMLQNSSAREVARWEAALNSLVDEKFVEAVGYKGQLFRVTHSGYEYVDQLKSA
ncbi:hypothetical protein KLJ63_03615 [Vibrio splendidus]|nr:hypothetical protein KLJ63_03615 [Vibrio splendidus]